VKELMKRVNVNDAGAIYHLGNYYHHGQLGLHQDRDKAMEFYARAADLGCIKAHFCLGNEYRLDGDMKNAKFHYEAAAMAGDELARYSIGIIENKSGNMDRALKHWTIAASAGYYPAMQNLLIAFNHGVTSRNEIDSFLTAYNNCCAEMRSEARDAYIHAYV
jgi:TPR repeat protein